MLAFSNVGVPLSLEIVAALAAESLLASGKFFTPRVCMHATYFPRACNEAGSRWGANGTSAARPFSLTVSPVGVFEEPPHPATIREAASNSRSVVAVVDLDAGVAPPPASGRGSRRSNPWSRLLRPRHRQHYSELQRSSPRRPEQPSVIRIRAGTSCVRSRKKSPTSTAGKTRRHSKVRKARSGYVGWPAPARPWYWP